MKSLSRLTNTPVTMPLLADDVVEFHAARILLLLKLCGVNGTIDSLTKLAKLDFFVRYPKFYAELCRARGIDYTPIDEGVESFMVRFHYGPWDQRYYHVLAFLEAKQVIKVTRHGRAFMIELTQSGDVIAQQLSTLPSFQVLCAHMHSVGVVLGHKSGTQIKNEIYDLFDKQVTALKLDSVIQQ